MRTRLLLVLILVAVLPGTGWAVEEEVGVYYKPVEPISEMPQGMARWKREFLQQEGIFLGLNGMAVGGKRRMVIAPNLVCYQGAVGESTAKGADPMVTCNLVVGEGFLSKYRPNEVRKETLIVEATLTASCIPSIAGIPRVFTWETCRDSDMPSREPGDPIWRAY